MLKQTELQPQIDPSKYNLHLLEGIPNVLATPPPVSDKAYDARSDGKMSDAGKQANKEKDPILEKLKQKVVIWLGKSLDDIAHKSFDFYASEVMSEKESRVYFSDQLILYTIRLMQFISIRYPLLWNRHKESIIKEYDDNSKEALEYLMKKYPLKEGGSVLPELQTLIPIIDRTEDMNYDMLNKANIMFTRGNIGSTVKQMLNYFIQLSKRLLPDFRKEMTKIFTLPNKEGKEEPIYNLIGMKFSDNLEQYSDAQIKEAGIKIKGPEVLRVIIKWIEGLENRCKEVDKYIMNRYYPFVDVNGQDVKLTFKDRDLLATNVKKEFELVKEYDKKTNGKVATILFDLFEFIKTQKERFRYIEEKQVETGLFTTILASSISSMAAQFLQTLIDHILCSTDKYKLITFNVSDLLRSKCVGNKDQIKEIFSRLQKVFTVVRVKNRLHTSNHDFLCNFYYQGILCEVQLGIAVGKGTHTHKQDCYGHFSHFLYELSRSKFSALTEAAIINNSGNPSIVYFRDKLTKRRKTRINTSLLEEIKVSVTNSRIEIQGFEARENTTPQFCNYCCQFKPAYSSFLDMFESVSRGKKICGQCYIEKLDKSAKASYLIGDLSQFFQEVEDINSYLKSFMSFQEYYMLVLFKTYNKKVQALHKPKSMDDLCDVLIKYRSGKYSFYPKKQIEQKAFFIFQLKKELTVFKDPRQMFYNHKDLSFIEPQVTLNQLKQMNEQLLYVLNDHRMVILNNECTNELKRQRHNMIKIKTLGDKDWWVMEAENIDQSFFENKRIKGFLQSVKKLEISDNHLKELSFLAKRSLVYLNVSGNQIAAIDLRDFKFQELKYLNLSKNLIQTIKLYDCKLSLLQIFIADTNKLTVFDFGAAFLPVLKELKLDNNRLMKLDNFGNIPFNELEKLHLEENLLENTDFLKEKQLKSLLMLKIENNKLNNLDGLYTTDMPKIQYLSLGSIVTLDLKNWNKYKMGQLKQLYIRNGNSVEGLKNLNRFYSLQKITIEVNKFRHLQFGELNLKQLTQLTIINNELEQIESLRKVTMQNLKILDLKKNRLRMMDFTGLNFNQITQLYLERNQLTHISCIDRCSMPQLRTFNLSDNVMEELHFGSADFRSLRTLSVSRNRLRIIYGFSEFPQGLELPATNVISTLSNSTATKKPANLPQLQQLHLDDNKLQFLFLARMNLPNLTVLNVQKNRIREIMGCRSAHLPKLSQLHLNENNLKKLPMAQLQIVSLTQLYLSKCNIETFFCPSDVRMPKLQCLDLSHNKLVNIDFSYFTAHQLKDLVLFNNQINQVISLDPKHFANLKSINMVENQLEYLSLDNMNFEKLEVMNYDKNKITKLNAMTKVDLKALTTLTLSNNKLAMINFANLKLESLNKLDLRSNLIQIIKNFEESELKNLKNLLLDENQLSMIELKGQSAKNLTSIDLSMNKLTVFDVVRHTPLNYLKTININNNEILELNFQGVSLDQLVTLNAEINRIQQVNFTKCNFPKITSIILRNNKLRSVKGMATAVMPKLEQFYLEFNLIQQLNFETANLPSLHTLNLRDNWLNSLIIDDAKMPQLRFFYLNNMVPRRIKDKFGNEMDVFNKMENLNLARAKWLNIETLYLEASGISNLGGMNEAQMPKLRQLNLNSNALKEFSAEKKFELLEVITLNRNAITTLKNIKIMKNTNLRHLTISHNLLTELSFKNLQFTCLEQLDLSFNQISKMDDLSTAKLPNLYELNLQHNQLQQFNLDKVHLHRLYILNLGQNSLRQIKGLNNCRLTNLSTLNLCTNSLMSLDFRGCNIPNIQYIMLRDNPQLLSIVGLEDPVKQKLKQIDIAGCHELRRNANSALVVSHTEEKLVSSRRMERHPES